MKEEGLTGGLRLNHAPAGKWVPECFALSLFLEMGALLSALLNETAASHLDPSKIRYKLPSRELGLRET